MNELLLIIGAGGHGKVVADIAAKMDKWKRIAFLDDKAGLNTVMGFQVLGSIEDSRKFVDQADFFVAIGNNGIRERILKKLIDDGLSIATLIHPEAVIGTDVKISTGTVVMAGAVINCSCRIGFGCIINTHSSIDHDNSIDDFVHVSPGVTTAGLVRIGKRTWLGVGSVVSNSVSVCGDCIVGAGSVIVKDLNESGTYIGVPAKLLNEKWRLEI